MIIKLIRHGQSEANIRQVNSTEIGDSNVKLTPTGIEQAQRAGHYLGAEFVNQSLLYTSSYLRSKQTMMNIIDGSNCVSLGEVPRMYEDPRLRESEFGYDKEHSDIDEEKKIRDRQGYFYYRYQGGESPADVYDRISTFLETLMRQIERKRATRVIIVSHGITIRCFVMRFMHLTTEQFDCIENPDHCDIITLITKSPVLPAHFTSGKWGVYGLKFRKSDNKSQSLSDCALPV